MLHNLTTPESTLGAESLRVTLPCGCSSRRHGGVTNSKLLMGRGFGMRHIRSWTSQTQIMLVDLVRASCSYKHFVSDLNPCKCSLDKECSDDERLRKKYDVCARQRTKTTVSQKLQRNELHKEAWELSVLFRQSPVRSEFGSQLRFAILLQFDTERVLNSNATNEFAK